MLHRVPRIESPSLSRTIAGKIAGSSCVVAGKQRTWPVPGAGSGASQRKFWESGFRGSKDWPAVPGLGHREDHSHPNADVLAARLDRDACLVSRWARPCGIR